VVTDRADVAIVGAGPAGLAAAVELRRRGVGSVVVLDREESAGGIPRHACHSGFGLRDLRRVLPGPRYAAHRAELALAAGAELRLRTQVTGWNAQGALELTTPTGRHELAADAVVLATGCRERPRAARLIAGTRPQGVMNTGMLQQLVYLAHERVGQRAVVVGAEHVSYSALLTLHHGGARAVAMTTELRHQQSLAAFRVGAAARFGTRLRTRTAVTAIRGDRRVQAVELTALDSGRVHEVECDVLVLTADWVPDHELAVLAGAELDPGTRGPAVDAMGRTSRPALFAAGNVLHGAEPADVAALNGRHVAGGVLDHLAGSPWPLAPVRIMCAEPLAWIVPNRVPAGRYAPGRHRLRSREELHDVRVEVRQDGRCLHRQRLVRLVPGRSASIPAPWAAAVDPGGGEVVVLVTRARRWS